MTTQAMKDVGLVDYPLAAEDVRTVLLALHEAEEVYLRRAARYLAAGFSGNHTFNMERAGNVQKLAAWISSHANGED